MKNLLFFCALFIFSVIACKDDDDTAGLDCATVTYSGDIKSIVETSCSGSSDCHGSGSTNGDYTTYDLIKDVATNGSMKQEVVIDKTMPAQGGPLSDLNIEKIECWINAGAPNN